MGERDLLGRIGAREHRLQTARIGKGPWVLAGEGCHQVGVAHVGAHHRFQDAAIDGVHIRRLADLQPRRQGQHRLAVLVDGEHPHHLAVDEGRCGRLPIGEAAHVQQLIVAPFPQRLRHR